MYKPFMFFLSLIFLVSCKTTHYANPEDYTGRMISVGEGGGFTGQTHRYTILENGQVFVKTTLPESAAELDKLSKKTADEIFKRFDALRFSEIDFNHPGNMTYFIAYGKDKDRHEVKWGDGNFAPPQEILEFYRYVKSELPIK